jgi:hypothetical protein
MYEIALTRIFSVTMWYHFAFVAISVALFGMTAGALAVHLFPNRFAPGDIRRRLWTASLLFSAAIAVCFAAQLSIRFDPRFTLGSVASIALTCVIISIPFIYSGIIVCLALTRFPAQVNRLYATDLIGAGIGCILLVVLFAWFDGPSLVILVGAIAAVGALVFAADAGSRRGMAFAGALVLVLGGFAVVNANLSTRGDAILRIRWSKGVRDTAHTYERWNAFSRLTVDGNPYTDSVLNLVIDSTAGTGLTRYSSETDALRNNLRNLAYNIRPNPDVMVVGVGGGSDVLSALEFDAQSVTGAEINGDILDIVNHVYGDFTGHLDRDPRVHFVNDEARSYLTGTDKRFDIIQISLTDTWAATSAGAFALSENALYTTDAWKVYLDRLKPGGILTVTRYYNTPRGGEPLETERLTALAAQALTDRGIADPRSHLLIYSKPLPYDEVGLATMLVSLGPFSPADLTTLSGVANRQQFDRVLTPEAAINPFFVNLVAPGGPGPAVERRAADISPPTDDRPYFFQMANLDTFFNGDILNGELTTRPVLVLGILALIVLCLAAIVLFVPPVLVRRRHRGERALRGLLPFYLYFGGIGFGFLVIEISQLQRLSVFLGTPTNALTVVLFSMLLFSGVGSMVSERFVRADRGMTLVAPLVILLGFLVFFGAVTPVVIRHMAGATSLMRIATAVALLAPLGLMMGMPFAIGMRAAARRDGAPTAFFWGINGALSICGSVFGLVIALFWGISTAFRVGSLSYLLAAVSMAAIARATVRRAPAGNGEHIPNEPSPVEDRYAEQLHDRHPTSVKAAGCAHMCAGFLPMTD